MLMAIFALLFIITQPLSGRLSDKVGRSPPISAGLSLGIISLVILPLLTSFPLLAIALALYGLAYGLLFPSIAALIAEHSEPEERGMATGIFHSLLTAGVAIGAPTMGWVGGAIGIKLGIMLSSGIMVIALITALKTVKP
jgi:MFS family permease